MIKVTPQEAHYASIDRPAAPSLLGQSCPGLNAKQAFRRGAMTEGHFACDAFPHLPTLLAASLFLIMDVGCFARYGLLALQDMAMRELCGTRTVMLTLSKRIQSAASLP